MDFGGELLESGGFNAILVVTDRCINVPHYLPVETTWTAADVANACINEIWRRHGLQRHITYDRGSQFANKSHKELNHQLNINLCLTTAYNPQTDGLSKRVVRTRNKYLRIYCHDRQNRWRAWLPPAEFACNCNGMPTLGFIPRACI